MQQRGTKPTQKEDAQVGQMLAGYISYWPLFLMCLTLALGAAYFYIKYSIPKYEATAKILIKDDKKGATDSKTLEQLDAISTKKIIDNEMEVLQSQQLLDSVVVKLGLYAPISQEGKFKAVSALHSFPLVIKVKQPEKITGWNEKIPLSYDKKNRKAIVNNSIACPVGQWVNTKYGELMFIDNTDFRGTKEDKPFYFDLVKVQAMGNVISAVLKVEASGKNSSVINLTYTDEVPIRAERILNELIHYYNQSAIIEKNNLVKNTVTSIDARLAVLQKDIDSTQKKVKNFRASNRAVDLGSQASQSLNIVASSDIKAAEADMQLKALNDLKKVVTTNDKIGILPSAMGINDPALTQQMSALQNAQIELERMKKTVGEGNPIILELKEQIAQMKPGIASSIQTQIQNVELSRGTYAATSGRFNSTLGAIPEKERELLGISRDLNTQNGIYSYLLQKKEESELSFTNTNTDSKVVNYGEAGAKPVSPKTSLIYVAAFVLGLILPIAIVNGTEMLNNKILYRKEIESFTSIPVIGEIVYNKTKTSLVLEPGKRSFIAEEFRKVRVSLLFLGIDSYHKKILVTSSLPGEGKSFVAANLAVSLAMTGKKVVLVDADLHNPSLGKLFGVTTEDIGVSDFLLGERKVDEIVRAVPNHENLSFVSSGGLHPTPSELLENGEIQKLISSLEDRFDLVVIDTAPVVMVTDAYHLSSLADATLYVIRHKYTPKMVVKRIDENNKINSLKNPAIVFNGVKTRGFMKNNYGYGYDYVYGKNQKKNKGYKLKA